VEISANLSDTTRILANGWTRPDKPEPVESTIGEKVLVRHAQGSAGPDGPVSQAQEQTGTRQIEKRVQGAAEPEQTASTSRVYSRSRSLRAIRQRLAIFSRRV